jgi:tetratricopeptide (TPR) repeat protein
VLARSLLALGRAEMSLTPRTSAIAPLREATAVALRAGHDAIAVEAYARRAWVEGTNDRTAGGVALDGIAIVEALAERIPNSGFVRALLHNSVAAVELAAGHRDRERAALQRAALAAAEVPEPVPIELLRIRGNLASHETDPARRATLFATTVAALSARLGDEHPITLDARYRAALLIEDPAAAAAALAPCCASYLRLHPGRGDAIASCWFEVGWIASGRRDADAAVRALTAAAAQRAEPERLAISRGYLALVQGDHAAATRAFDEVIAALPASGPWWSQLMVGDAHLGRGLARRAAGEPRRADDDLAAAEALLAPVATEQPYPYIAWRLARVRAERR